MTDCASSCRRRSLRGVDGIGVAPPREPVAGAGRKPPARACACTCAVASPACCGLASSAARPTAVAFASLARWRASAFCNFFVWPFFSPAPCTTRHKHKRCSSSPQKRSCSIRKRAELAVAAVCRPLDPTTTQRRWRRRRTHQADTLSLRIVESNQLLQTSNSRFSKRLGVSSEVLSVQPLSQAHTCHLCSAASVAGRAFSGA